MLLLCVHWITTPIVVSIWTSNWFWSAVFTLCAVFVMWALNFIAMEIEQPFGDDANDVDVRTLQVRFNKDLVMLLDSRVSSVPRLMPRAMLEYAALRDDVGQ